MASGNVSQRCTLGEVEDPHNAIGVFGFVSQQSPWKRIDKWIRMNGMTGGTLPIEEFIAGEGFDPREVTGEECFGKKGYEKEEGMEESRWLRVNWSKLEVMEQEGMGKRVWLRWDEENEKPWGKVKGETFTMRSHVGMGPITWYGIEMSKLGIGNRAEIKLAVNQCLMEKYISGMKEGRLDRIGWVSTFGGKMKYKIDPLANGERDEMEMEDGYRDILRKFEENYAEEEVVEEYRKRIVGFERYWVDMHTMFKLIVEDDDEEFNVRMRTAELLRKVTDEIEQHAREREMLIDHPYAWKMMPLRPFGKRLQSRNGMFVGALIQFYRGAKSLLRNENELDVNQVNEMRLLEHAKMLGERNGEMDEFMEIEIQRDLKMFLKLRELEVLIEQDKERVKDVMCGNEEEEYQYGHLNHYDDYLDNYDDYGEEIRALCLNDAS